MSYSCLIYYQRKGGSPYRLFCCWDRQTLRHRFLYMLGHTGSTQVDIWRPSSPIIWSKYLVYCWLSSVSLYFHCSLIVDDDINIFLKKSSLALNQIKSYHHSKSIFFPPKTPPPPPPSPFFFWPDYRSCLSKLSGLQSYPPSFMVWKLWSLKPTKPDSFDQQ